MVLCNAAWPNMVLLKITTCLKIVGQNRFLCKRGLNGQSQPNRFLKCRFLYAGFYCFHCIYRIYCILLYLFYCFYCIFSRYHEHFCDETYSSYCTFPHWPLLFRRRPLWLWCLWTYLSLCLALGFQVFMAFIIPLPPSSILVDPIHCMFSKFNQALRLVKLTSIHEYYIDMVWQNDEIILNFVVKAANFAQFMA